MICNRPVRLAAALLAAALLAGCGASNNTTITIIEPAPAPMGEDDYAAAGYYAPDAPAVYDGQIMPGAPDLTDWTQPQAGAPNASDVAPAEPGTVLSNMTKGDMTYGVVVGEDAVINPFRCTYRDFYAVNQLVFESVVGLDESLRPVPTLAEHWEHEGGEWVFTLRSGVKFHSGELLTAYDVVASYEEIRRNPGTLWHELTQHIGAMQAIDDQTLRVKSGGTGYMVLYAMTFPVAQRNTVSTLMPMGTGPYWYIRYDQGIALRLESSTQWWKRASGAVNSVVVICYKTVRSAMVGLELNEVDAIATDYPTASLSRSLTDRLTRDYSTQTYECVVPNLKGSILSDLSVRQALMYAIDRATLGNTIYAGMVQESEVPVIPGSWLYEPLATRYHYSPERALQLLRDAGWSDADQDGVLEKNINGQMTRLSLNLVTYDRGTTATRSEAVEEIARQLRLVGFEITTQTKSAAKALEDLNKGNFDLALVGFELSLVPNLAFLLASNAKDSSNFARYASSAMDGYLYEAYDALTEAELKAAMSKVQMQVVEDLPILGLFFRAGVLISRASVGGLSGSHQYDVLRGMATITPAK